MQTTWPLGTSHSPDKDLSIFTDRSLAFCILHLHATVLDRRCMQLPHPIRPSHLRLNITTRNISFNFLSNCWLISEFFSFPWIYAWKNLTLGQVAGQTSSQMSRADFPSIWDSWQGPWTSMTPALPASLCCKSPDLWMLGVDSCEIRNNKINRNKVERITKEQEKWARKW